MCTLGKGQNYENENIKSKFCQRIRTSKVSIKVIRTTTTTYGVLPMDTKACGGLG